MDNTKAEWQKKILDLIHENRKRDLALHQQGPQSLPTCISSLDMADLKEIETCGGSGGHRGLLYHQGLDLFLRTRLDPLQAVFTSLMHGAKAQVNGENIPFNEIITWCQEAGDVEKRRALARETRSLCRFLAPYSQASWKGLLSILKEEFGYRDYLAYCEEKRGILLSESRDCAVLFLDETAETYRRLLGPFLKKVTGLPLSAASRFDAIHLLGLRYLDHFFPSQFSLDTVADLCSIWGEDLLHHTAIRIDLTGKAGRQSYCIPVAIPGEIHIITGPVHGWLDLEAFFHELGHALGLSHSDPGLPVEEREFFQSWSLSESFAFLFQRICMSREFLHDVLGLSQESASLLSSVHAVKMLTLARRYAAKLLIEVENFSRNRLKKGEQLYAEIMARETGFQYDPATYLFDIMPDFYSLDYFQGFLGSACLWDSLTERLGEKWWSHAEAGTILRNWWRHGNSMDTMSFLEHVGEKPFSRMAFITFSENIEDVGRLSF